MGYEDIEPPSPEVDKLYKAIVADYKAEKYSSQEEALSILESQYFFSFIEIKKEMSKDFETYPFYRWLTGEIDEYIRVCEKSETSLSSQMIDAVIKGVQKSDENGDDPEMMRSYDEIAKLVYLQVNKVYDLCCKNRETKKLYVKYRAEIEAMQDKGKIDFPQNTSGQLDNPEQIQRQIDKTIGILLKENYIKRTKNKKGNIEYRITETTTTTEVIEALKTKKGMNVITLPEIKDAVNFVIKYLKSKNGNPIKDALRAKKQRITNNKETPSKTKRNEQTRTDTN